MDHPSTPKVDLPTYRVRETTTSPGMTTFSKKPSEKLQTTKHFCQEIEPDTVKSSTHPCQMQNPQKMRSSALHERLHSRLAPQIFQSQAHLSQHNSTIHVLHLPVQSGKIQRSRKLNHYVTRIVLSNRGDCRIRLRNLISLLVRGGRAGSRISVMLVGERSGRRRRR